MTALFLLTVVRRSEVYLRRRNFSCGVNRTVPLRIVCAHSQSALISSACVFEYSLPQCCVMRSVQHLADKGDLSLHQPGHIDVFGTTAISGLRRTMRAWVSYNFGM